MDVRYSLAVAAACLILGSAIGQQREEQLRYVEQYRALAIWEMQRRGVPASIKLGQAILESRWGTTDLAVLANNHFGIKCGGREAWSGPEYYKFDDEYNRFGQPLKSCFREYRHPEESFIAHSEFLRNPLKEERYGFLFKLDPTDYKSWARGLKKAGYATDPQYHNKLIRIIEELNLSQYDRMSFDEAVLSGGGRQRPGQVSAQYESMAGELVSSYVPNPQRHISQRQESTSLAPIAVHVLTDLRNVFFSPSYRQKSPASALLWTYKEERDHPALVLRSFGRRNPHHGKSRYQGRPVWHLVRPNELMADISKEYGIEISALYKRNLIEEGSEVAAGQRVKLKGGKVERAPLVVSSYSNRMAATLGYSAQAAMRPDPLLRPFAIKERVSEQEKKTIPVTGGVPPLPLPPAPKPGISPSAHRIQPQSQRDVMYHIVQQGDTLYSISRKYGVSVESLRMLNRVQQDMIVAGTALRLR